MAGKLGLLDYISDDGNTYHIEMDASNASVQGAVAATLPARRNLPAGYVPRHIWAIDDADVTGGRVPTRSRRKVQITDPANTLWTGATTAVALPVFSVTPSVSVDWSVVAYVGEKRYNR